MSEVGVITEQGDLGLGFEPVTDEEEKVLKEAFGDKEEDDNKK